MIKVFALAAALAAPVSVGACAEVIDISTVKCSDLGTMTTEEASYLLVWLDGYAGGKAEDTTIDLNNFEEVAKLVGEKCAENPELGVMTAISQVTE